MKKYCISVHGVEHEMELLDSDLQGYYLYKLVPMELGYDAKIMYIAPDRADHWMYGKPMQGGKQINSSEIHYFYKLYKQKINDMKKTELSQKQIVDAANRMNASEFIGFLKENGNDYDILDQDNIFNANEGVVNIEIEGMNEGESLLFIDGEYQGGNSSK